MGKGEGSQSRYLYLCMVNPGSVLRNQVQSLICKTGLYRKRMRFAHRNPILLSFVMFIMAMSRDNVNAVGVGKTLPSTFRYLWFELSVKPWLELVSSLLLKVNRLGREKLTRSIVNHLPVCLARSSGSFCMQLAHRSQAVCNPVIGAWNRCYTMSHNARPAPAAHCGSLPR